MVGLNGYGGVRRIVVEEWRVEDGELGGNEYLFLPIKLVSNGSNSRE